MDSRSHGGLLNDQTASGERPINLTICVSFGAQVISITNSNAEMDSRRNIPAPQEGPSAHASGMIPHGPFSGADNHDLESLSAEELEEIYVSQAAELETLLADNRKLSSAHVALTQDLEASQQDVEKLREQIRSTQTEGDIQVRILLDKMAKWEAEIRAGERVKKDLQQAHLEARSLETAKQELNDQIQKANHELETGREDLKRLPGLDAELDELKQEHQRLRKTFEYEKGLNTEKVEQMKIQEKELVSMYDELERLRAEVAAKKANVSAAYGGHT